MALSNLNQLYMTLITDHAKSPHHYGALADIEPITLHNPSCGDVIHLFVKWGDDKVEDISFSGKGCSISTASASMMTDLVKGERKDDINELLELFSQLMQGQKLAQSKRLGDAEFLAGVTKFPQRIKCANLAWQAMTKVLTKQEN
ncbi:Fe-S cluster assembly sulfur transfer protein SufU [Streptococcus sp. sy004]|uniref:Fe-S cluster assembly sulfur transfer protein SufU n=1 Tax=Streptococcus sp. sy004 TaxID=2600149 RepID=UPI0011B595BB|nr:SUF system NifU family Fe-S cluster assembly protein [Streptococcus sp. sy004]TWT10997.1 SUF system NifU family Fe-S cluster assembly protein [Streptococcus sp. sy004]